MHVFNVLNKLRIGGRIVMALFIPAVAFIAVGTAILFEKRDVAAEMGKVERLAQLAPIISDLVHEMQKERGASAGFIGSKGTKFAEAVKSQRRETDIKRAAFDTAWDAFDTSDYSREFAELIVNARDKLRQLDGKRSAIDGLRLNVGEAAAYYTSTIDAFLRAVEHIAVLSSNAEVTKIIAAYTNLLQAKESTGQQRALGAAGFSAGQFSPPSYRRFVELIGLKPVLTFVPTVTQLGEVEE